MSQEKTRNRIWIDPFVDCDCCQDEEQDAYHMTYELPGVKKQDVKLKVTKDALRLTASKDSTDFVNEFTFPCDMDAEHVRATYENGLLNVEVPLDCPDPFKTAKAVAIA